MRAALRRGAAAARAVRGADGGRRSPSGIEAVARTGSSRRAARRCVPVAARRRAAAAVLRPAAAVVPRPARAGQRRLQHARRPAAAGRAGRGARWSAASTSWCAATRRCAPRSASRTGEPGAGHRRRQPSAACECIDLRRCRPASAADAEAPAAARSRGAAAVRPGAPGPLLRAAAAAAGRARSTCCCSCMHHIVSDGWSMGVLVRELARALRRPSPRASPSPLPELPVQYADYAAWQREWLQGDGAGGAARLLAASSSTGAPPALELPTDRPRPPVQTLRGRADCLSRCPRELPRRAEGAGRSARAPRSSWCCWPPSRRCCRATPGRTTSCVGTPIAGRNRGGARGADRLLRQHAGAARATSTATRPSASCWRGCARRRWAPTRTRTCRSRSWWRSCSPSAT